VEYYELENGEIGEKPTENAIEKIHQVEILKDYP